MVGCSFCMAHRSCLTTAARSSLLSSSSMSSANLSSMSLMVSSPGVSASRQVLTLKVSRARVYCMSNSPQEGLPAKFPARRMLSIARKHVKALDAEPGSMKAVAATVSTPGFLEVMSEELVLLVFAAQSFSLLDLAPAEVDRLRLRFKKSILPRLEEALADEQLASGGNKVLAPGKVTHDNMWLAGRALNIDSLTPAELAEIELFLPIILEDVLGKFLKKVSTEVSLPRAVFHPAPLKLAGAGIGVGATAGFALHSFASQLLAITSLSALPGVVQVSAVALAGGATGVAVSLAKTRSYENATIVDVSATPAWGTLDRVPGVSGPVTVSDLRRRVEEAGLPCSSELVELSCAKPVLALPAEPARSVSF